MVLYWYQKLDKYQVGGRQLGEHKGCEGVSDDKFHCPLCHNEMNSWGKMVNHLMESEMKYCVQCGKDHHGCNTYFQKLAQVLGL